MSKKNQKRRVAILADAQTHMMPALAREIARRDHALVLVDAVEQLGTELIPLLEVDDAVVVRIDLVKPGRAGVLGQRRRPRGTGDRQGHEGAQAQHECWSHQQRRVPPSDRFHGSNWPPGIGIKTRGGKDVNARRGIS